MILQIKSQERIEVPAFSSLLIAAVVGLRVMEVEIETDTSLLSNYDNDLF